MYINSLLLQSQGDLEVELGSRLPGTDGSYTPEKMGTAELAQALGLDADAVKSIESSRLLIYKYKPEDRLDSGSSLRAAPLVRYVPRGLFPLRKVPKSVRPGEHQVVNEVLFTTSVPAPRAEERRQGKAERFLRSLSTGEPSLMCRPEQCYICGHSYRGALSLFSSR